MKSAFARDISREIINTIGRFFAIFTIVALGVSFFAGIGNTGKDMKLTAEKYFDAQNLADIMVLSNYGLSQEDIKALAKTPGVQNVLPSYSLDAFAFNNEHRFIVKVHALPEGSNERPHAPMLTGGRFPEKGNEAVVEEKFLDVYGFEIGDTVLLEQGNKSDIRYFLKSNRYKIVGTIHHPFYLSYDERGNAGLGSGSVDSYLMIPAENFKQDVYTEAFVTVVGAKERFFFSEEYEDIIDAMVDTIKDVEKTRKNKRAIELTNKSYQMLKNAESALNSEEVETREYFNALEAEINLKSKELDESERFWEINIKEIDDLLLAMTTTEQQLLTEKSEAEDNLRSLEAAKSALISANKFWDEQEQLLTLISSISFALSEITQTKEEFLQLKTDAHNASTDFVSGGKELSESRKSLQEARAEISREIENKRQTLHEAKKELDELPDPKWYVLKREENPGHFSFKEDADKIQSLGQVFPLIFFMVAALVSLTTITRLVEERRSEIGTLKSLGYSNFEIMSKYLLYAFVPSLLGSLLGGLAGMKIFPEIIISAYRTLYMIPNPELPVSLSYWCGGAFLATAGTTLAAYFACAKALKETPADLLRPKAPPAGKRIILEKIPVLWSRFSFFQKITGRNILRYKKRFFMTVLGIGGCTALLLTGFGLNDAIKSILPKQFGEIFQYDMVISFSDDAKDGDTAKIGDILAANPIIQKHLNLRQKTMDAKINEGKTQSVTLIVPEKAEELDEFIVLRNRATRVPVKLAENGAVINEKLSTLLKVGVGDTILLQEGDDPYREVVVSGITENYYLNYVYMTKEYYKKTFKKDLAINSIYAVLDDNSKKPAQDDLADKVLDKKNVDAVTFTAKNIEIFQNTLESLNFVVLVLIVSAGALAFVVLLNLSSINISERARELATIEVLGFYEREISAYILKENNILSLFGALLGLFAGIVLHRYVITTLEVSTVMFGREISCQSFLFSLILTMLFTIAANWVSNSQIRKIDMVEALKSVE